MSGIFRRTNEKNQACGKSALKSEITVKAPVLETSAAVFPAKNTAGYRFDIMDGAKKARFTEVLKQKWAELLIFKGVTGKQAKPVIRISNTWWRIRPIPRVPGPGPVSGRVAAC